MPIFEFVCTECEKTFEELVLSLSKVDEVVCPACGGTKVKKKMSTFASKPAAGSGSFSLGTASTSSHSCGSGSV
jgi:putative FmdB family regulatory protein